MRLLHPGFIVGAAAFCERWRAEHGTTPPGREQIAEALAGHLCRCGAYEGIYRAVAAACAGDHDTAPAGTTVTTGTTGRETTTAAAAARAEAPEKTDGSARYTTDLHPEGLLEGVIIRSPHAHAHVRSLEAGDLPLVPLLPPDGIVRYVGQPVAAVAAPDRAAARRPPPASSWTTRCCRRPSTYAGPAPVRGPWSTRTRRRANGRRDPARPPS